MRTIQPPSLARLGALPATKLLPVNCHQVLQGAIALGDRRPEARSRNGTSMLPDDAEGVDAECRSKVGGFAVVGASGVRFRTIFSTESPFPAKCTDRKGPPWDDAEQLAVSPDPPPDVVIELPRVRPTTHLVRARPSSRWARDAKNRRTASLRMKLRRLLTQSPPNPESRWEDAEIVLHVVDVAGDPIPRLRRERRL